MNAKKKGKDPKEALKHTASKTLENGAYSYGIAFGGSLLGGMMHNNANQFIQNLSNGSMPTMIVGCCCDKCYDIHSLFFWKD